MTDGPLFDHEAAVKPLLDAYPHTQAIATCGLCGQRIHGPAGLYGNGFLKHPDECPPVPPPKPPEGMLL